jgi:hypothetical protein
MLLLVFPALADPILKAYIHGHYRLLPKTGKRIWIESHTDKRPERNRTSFDSTTHRVTHFQHHLGRGQTREAMHAFHDLNHADAHQLARHLGLAGDDQGKDKKELMESIYGKVQERKKAAMREPGERVEKKKRVGKKDQAAKPESTEYRYALRNRPLAPGAVPREGLVRGEPRPEKGADHYDSARHGFAVYSRTLTDKEIQNFELTPIAEGADRKRLVDQMAADMDEEEIADAADDLKFFRQGLSSRLEAMYGHNGVSVGDVSKFADEVLARARAGKKAPAAEKPAQSEPAATEKAAKSAPDQMHEGEDHASKKDLMEAIHGKLRAKGRELSEKVAKERKEGGRKVKEKKPAIKPDGAYEAMAKEHKELTDRAKADADRATAKPEKTLEQKAEDAISSALTDDGWKQQPGGHYSKTLKGVRHGANYDIDMTGNTPTKQDGEIYASVNRGWLTVQLPNGGKLFSEPVPVSDKHIPELMKKMSAAVDFVQREAQAAVASGKSRGLRDDEFVKQLAHRIQAKEYRDQPKAPQASSGKPARRAEAATEPAAPEKPAKSAPDQTKLD